MPISNITNARFEQKFFYITADALVNLGNPHEDSMIKVFPGSTTKASYEGRLRFVNDGRQGAIHCPALFDENFHQELPLPLMLDDQIDYRATAEGIRFFSR
jgi:hypothetical protein